MSETSMYIGGTILALLVLNAIGYFCALKFTVGDVGGYRVKEVMIMTGATFVVGALIASVVFGGYASSKALDTEIFWGEVTGKKKNRVSCEHSYSCNCRPSCSGSGNTRSCTTVCDTCYEHSYDIDWDVYTNIDHTFTIDRVDRQGLDKPPRWEITKIGEPVAVEHTYRNWLKAAKFSLKNVSETEVGRKRIVPNRPMNIYDYWHLDRFVYDNITPTELPLWNKDLMNLNKVLGPSKQASVVIVATRAPDREYATELYKSWQGGSKNDIIVVLGTPNFPTISWAEVFAMSETANFKVNLRNDIEKLGVADRNQLIPLIKSNTMRYFVRERMRKYEYLENEIVPPMDMVLWVIGLLVAATIGVYGTYAWVDRRKSSRSSSSFRGRYR